MHGCEILLDWPRLQIRYVNADNIGSAMDAPRPKLLILSGWVGLEVDVGGEKGGRRGG